MEGRTISHYTILEKLGEGPTGTVYRAEDTKRNRLVALKFLPIRQKLSDLDKAALKDAATRASQLQHPNICAFYSLKVEKDEYFLVMELAEGKALRELMPVMSQQVGINYAIAMASALQDAHGKGILHRNLRPGGVIVNPKRRLKVLGFGQAALKDILKIQRAIGVPEDAAYLSPEQIEGVALDTRSDIFSLGVLLYHMLAAKVPFRGDHEAAMFYSVQNEKPLSVRQFRPDLSPGFVSIIEKSLEKKPADRYQSATEILTDLRHLKRASFSISKVFTRTSTAPVKPATRPFTRFQGKRGGMSLAKMMPLLLGILALILLAIIGIRALINP